MGRLAFQLAGTAIGFYIGGPQGAAVGGAIGGAVGGAVFDEDTNVVVEGPRLQDLTVAGSAYGSPIPWIFGTQRTGSTMIWATDIIEVRQEETVDAGGGGKGGPSSSQTNVTFKYQGNMALLFCRGPKDILSLWADGKLVYDTQGSGQLSSGKFTDLMTTYSGSTTQEPDPTIQSFLGVADTPAYRDFCYMVARDFWLEDFGNRLPQWNALVSDATDEYPTDSLEILVNNGTSFLATMLNAGVRTNDDRYYITSLSQGDILVIDLLAVEVVNQAPLNDTVADGLGNRMMIDSAGNMVWVSEANGADWGVYIFSVPELKLLALLRNQVSSQSYREYAISPQQGPPVEGVEPSDRIACLTASGLVHVWPSNPQLALQTITTESGTETRFDDVPIYELDLLDFISPSSPATAWALNTDGGANVDQSGDIWFCILDNQAQQFGDMYLVQFNPWAGAFLFSVLVPVPDGANGMTRGGLLYDPLTHKLAIRQHHIGAPGDQLIQYDIDTNTFSEHLPTGFNLSDLHKESWNGRWAINSKHWYSPESDTSREEYDFVTHSVSRTILTVDEFGLPALTTGGVLYSPLNNAVLVGQPGTDIIYWLYLDRLSSNSVTLKFVVDEISSEVGMALTKIDTDELQPFIVQGYGINRRMNARSSIEPLRKAYFFDATESDYMMKFVLKGAEPVLTLTDDDLGTTNSTEETAPLLVEERKQEVELPLRVDFQYSNPDFEYQQGSQYAKRADEAVITLNQVRIDTAIVFSDDEAKAIVERLLYNPWVERDRKKFVTTWQHLALDPTDVVLLQLDNGLSFRVYVSDVDTSIEGLIDVGGALQDPEVSVIRSTATGQASDGFDPTQLIAASGSTIHIMDVPLLQDGDERSVPILHSAAGRVGQVNPGGNTLEWLGARIDRSFDGILYGEWTFHNSATEMTHGFVPLALPSTTAPWVWDRTNTINVKMKFGVLTSTTEAIVLDTQTNSALIGNEIIQFVNATLQNDGSYNLDTLLRARRGTEVWARANNGISHVADERFVMLTLATINVKSHVVDNLNRAQFFRGVTVGSPGLASDNLTPVGRSKMPYAPYLVVGDRHSYGDVELSWTRRTRIGGAIDWQAGPSEPPLSEETETYQIAVIDSQGIEVASHSVTDVTQFEYSAVQSDIDFGTDLDPVTDTVSFIIYQISATVGRGFPSETVTV